jgi:dolichol-phosphate mannosyltransferase
MTATVGRIAPQKTVEREIVLDGGPELPKYKATRRATNYLPYRYSLNGVITIGSEVVLRELEYFRAPWVAGGYDIEIRVGHAGKGTRRRTTVTTYANPAAINYAEHLGRLGANFQVRIGDTIEVSVTPLLARSPHVVYTNVIEALLRFLFVSQGYMLLHSACLELDGIGVILSARTDTGKTGTVLRLVGEQGAKFLSDDMTIINEKGQAWAFPKPLTISQHTLRAINVDELGPREWRWLKVQSRLHSKGGRKVGLALGDLNLPIMGMNAVTQLLVPPPKYPVDRLVPCEIAGETMVEQIFIIERGDAALHHVSRDEALSELIDNTDDAYNFPPFRYFAPALTIGDENYEQLRAHERDILASALAHTRVRRIACDDFSWAASIPALLHVPQQDRQQVASVLSSAAGRRGVTPA